MSVPGWVVTVLNAIVSLIGLALHFITPSGPVVPPAGGEKQ